MAAVTTIGSLNPHQPAFVIYEFYGAGHYCHVRIFPLPGTDMSTINRLRKCILVSRGRIEYIGLHLDLGRAKEGTSRLENGIMEVFDTLEEGMTMYAERCGGVCGGARTPPPAPPPPPRTPSPTSTDTPDAPAQPAVPTHVPSIILARVAPDNFVITHIPNVGETEAAMLRARAGGSEAFRRWYVEPGRRIYMNASSTAHYVRKWSEEGSRPDVRVTRSVNHAIYLAFGTTLAPDDILRFVISTDLGYQSLVATTLSQCKYYLLHLTYTNATTVSRADASEVLDDSSHADSVLGRILPRSIAARSLAALQGTDYGSDVFDHDTDQEEEEGEEEHASGEHDDDDDAEYARVTSAEASAPAA